MTSTVASLLREYHRRLTHYRTHADRTPFADAQVQGELIGLRGALGIVLGGAVQGGDADRLAVQEYNRWLTSGESDTAACACTQCQEGSPA